MNLLRASGPFCDFVEGTYESEGRGTGGHWTFCFRDAWDATEGVDSFRGEGGTETFGLMLFGAVVKSGRRRPSSLTSLLVSGIMIEVNVISHILKNLNNIPVLE